MTNMTILSDITGNVWKINVKVGDKVAEGDILVILESMKMEIPVEAPNSGTIMELLVKEDDAIAENQGILILKP